MPLTMTVTVETTDPKMQDELRVAKIVLKVVDPSKVEPADLPHADVSPEETRINGTPQYVAPTAEHTVVSDEVRNLVAALETNGVDIKSAYIDFENGSGGIVRRDGIRTVDSIGMKNGNAV